MRGPPFSTSAWGSRALALAALVASAGALGCEDLSQFTTAAGEAYCGSITLGSSFRQGLSPRVQMRLTLDAAALDGPGSPGLVSTYEAADAVVPEVRLLTNEPLRIVTPIEHDPLSRLDFGDGRERSAVYAVSPTDPTEESFVTFVSLKHDSTVEVRLLRAGRTGLPGEAPPAGQTTIFGLFPLTKRAGDCGF